MRYLYATAAAIAPLIFASAANAQVVIDSTRTTPITTANPTGSGPANINIITGGSISLTSGTALTINSSNDVEITGTGNIAMVNSANGSTAILIEAGNTANLVLEGTIGVTDDLGDAEDTDDDGDADGRFANGTGRYGIRLNGAGALTGDIDILTQGSILVEGNESFGISLESDLIGNLISHGSIRVVGDNSMAIRSLGTIDGNVYIGGQVSSLGESTSAIGIYGDVNGRLSIQGTITSSGYRYSTRPTDEAIANLDADDLLQGGPAVIVASNVSGGVTFGTRPDNDDDDNPDEDDDGVPDAEEGSLQITSYGEAPAVLIGSETGDITLGLAGSGDLAYGLINQGQITAQGVYDGITATAIRLGTDAGHNVFIDGGILNSGTVAALAFDADAVGVRVSAGVSTPQFVNSGALTAANSSDVTSTINVLLIEAGASLPAFVNSGQLLGSSGGGTADITAILDLSGTLTSITNTGSMQANLGFNEDGSRTGTTTLINVEANTSGVTIVQDGVVTADSDSPDSDGDGVLDSDEPIMVGAILLGSGDDVVDIRNGVVLSDISFGDGLDILNITGGANVISAISDSDALLDINVTDGILDARSTGAVDISNLDVGADGRLIVTIDGANATNAGFNVSGTANFADGAEIGVRFSSLIDGPSRFTIIDAANLNFGNLDTAAIQENAPYLFILDAGADLTTNQVYVDVRRRTAEEAGFIAVEADAYDAIYEALDRDQNLLDVFISQSDREDFINLYEQMLPDHSGGPLLSLASGVDAVTRALVGRNASAAPGQTSAWVQEISFYADKDKTDSYGFRSEGFGFAGGVEYGTSNGAVGLTVAFTSSDLEDPEAEAQENLTANLIELGLYWRAQGQYWTTWARAAAGYASFDAERQFVGGGLNLRNESSWSGFTLAAAGGASYSRDYGRFTLRPEIYAEYFSLSEEAREEVGGGDGFDLIIDERDGHMFSAVAAMNIAYTIDENSWLKPEFRIGWRQNLSVDPGETIARFASGGSSFTLDPGTIEGGGPIVGFRLNVGNELGMLSVSADAEMIGDYIRYMLFLRASFRF